MQVRTMKLPPVKRGKKGAVRKVASSLPTAEFVRQACDEFIELRREHVNFGKSRLVSGFATIARHSVLILIHGRNGRRGKNRIPESARRRASGFRKTDHLMQLAHKFKKPIVVCFVDPASSSGLIPTEPYEALGLPKHILSQWCLDVPIVIVILTSKSTCDIFGVWLADKTIALEQAQFVMSIPDSGRIRRINLSAEELVRGGVIDKTIPALSHLTGHSQAAMSYRLRNALVEILDDVSHKSSKELIATRQEKLARVEAMSAKPWRQGKSV